MTDTILAQSNRIALEAAGATDIQGLFRGFFPTVQNFFHEFTSRFSPNQQSVVLNRNEKAFYAEIQKHSYLDVSPLLAFVPEGLDANYLPYSNTLMDSAEYCNKLLNGVLNQYSVFLANLLTNHDQKLDTTVFTPVYEKQKMIRDKFNKDIGDCFKAGSSRADSTIGEVIARTTDWPRVFDNCHQLSKLISEVNRNSLNKKVAECSELLDRIMDKMKRNELDGMSPEVATNLANGAHAMASELEFFAATYFRIMTFVSAVNQTIEQTRKTLAQA